MHSKKVKNSAKGADKKGRTQGVGLLFSKTMKIFITSSHCISACCYFIRYSLRSLLKHQVTVPV